MTEYIIDATDALLGDAFDARAWYGARLKEELVRCRDCRHSNHGGTMCAFFASWEPVAGGDEYERVDAIVEPDGFCKWGERRSST